MEDATKYQKPDAITIREKLTKISGWFVVNNRLEKSFKFENFARAMVFVNKIVNPIEENQNYPKIVITYNTVLISLFTNEAGGITLMDLEMADQINRLGGEKKEKDPGIKA